MVQKLLQQKQQKQQNIFTLASLFTDTDSDKDNDNREKTTFTA